MREPGYRLMSFRGLSTMAFDPLTECGFLHGMTLKDDDVPRNDDDIYRLLSENGRLAVTEQSHSTDLIAVERDGGCWYPERISADGLMTDEPGIILSIHTADCVPIFLASPLPRAAALIHCGWRGTANSFASKALSRFCLQYRLELKNVIAVIGPAICQRCYPVGAEVAGLFSEDLKVTIDEHHWLLDIKMANHRQLVSSGLKEENIYCSPLCTRCRPDLFYSYRLEGRDLKGKMISFIEVGEDETER